MVALLGLARRNVSRHSGRHAMHMASAALGLALIGSGLSGAPAASAAIKPALIVGIYTEGGFVSPSWTVSRLPQLLVYSNGTVVTENAKPKHGYVHEALTGTIAPSKALAFANDLLRLAKAPRGGWGFPGVADVPDTRIKVSLGDKRLNNSVYALAFTNGPQLKPAQVAARKALSAAITKFQKSLTTTIAYQPSVYEVWGLTTAIGTGSNGSMGMPNPAAVYCTSIGGETGSVQTADGEAGTCKLYSGEVVDEWVLYRTALETLPIWPAGYTVPSVAEGRSMTACVVIAARNLKQQLAKPSDDGRWLLPSGQAFPIVIRPVLKGERACHRTA